LAAAGVIITKVTGPEALDRVVLAETMQGPLAHLGKAMMAVMENPLAVAEVVALVLWVEMPLEILVGMAEVALLQQILSSR
tara:strand:+ start:558 stop:800 length:243 start_codon:yes stop_codon:yes gene_type:complete